MLCNLQPATCNICTLWILKPDHKLSCEIVDGDRHPNKLRVCRQHSHLIIFSNTLAIAILVSSELTLLVIAKAFSSF